MGELTIQPLSQLALEQDEKVKQNIEIAVIGGGVVGCAVARRLALEGAKVTLLEKAADLLEGASKGNSAILHTGFDAPPGSLEQVCVQQGYREFLEIRQAFNLPLLETGALIAAWTEEQEERFPDILAKSQLNGVDNLRLLTRDQALAREPELGPTLRAALLVPGEFVIDPWSTPLAYLQQALANGGQVLFNAEVTGGIFDGDTWQLTTQAGLVQAHYVINCAGLYGDRLDQQVLGETSFTIKPRKGQFVVFDKIANSLLRSIILPVPTARTKGIVVFPTIFGNLLVGPTAEDQDDRADASVDKQVLESLRAQAIDKLPALADIPVTATFAGLRPATEQSEYRIVHDPDRHWLTLGGIRSTGLTASLGLARHVHQLLLAQGMPLSSIAQPVVPRLPNLAEHLPRDWQTPGYGQMVCHCEKVTDREILAALDGPIPPGNFGGLKRRTRASMGRCQGFHCSAHLAKLTAGRFAEPLVVGETDENSTQ